MAMISEEALAGYLLEEALSYLLGQNGYHLLEAASEDKDALRDAGHGLLVRGRGADHQADALGELLVPVPFSLPVRLFVEAKNRRDKVTLRDVRNAHGVVSDVNEYYTSAHPGGSARSLRRFSYQYSIFSTSGFKREAQRYAMAQQISLVDLSGAAFAPLDSAISDATRTVLAEAVRLSLETFPVREVRTVLREAFKATQASRSSAPSMPNSQASSGASSPSFDIAFLRRWAVACAARIAGSSAGEGLLLGFPHAPFILAMRPDSTQKLEEYVSTHSSEIAVNIEFDRPGVPAGEWVITPIDEPSAFSLSFGLPGLLEEWLLSVPAERASRSADATAELLSSISFFLEDRVVRLLFKPSILPPTVSAASADGVEVTSWYQPESGTDESDLRRQRRAATTRNTPMRAVEDSSILDSQLSETSGGWTADGARLLMERLDGGDYIQARLIREAAQSGGTLTRARIFELAGFPSNRTLRGLTRPPCRITGELVGRNLLPTGINYPFLAVYDRGFRATHFLVPNDLVTALHDLEGKHGE